MNPFRCSNCNKLLAKIDGKSRVEIVCPKCKTMNVISEIFDMSEPIKFVGPADLVNQAHMGTWNMKNK